MQWWCNAASGLATAVLYRRWSSSSFAFDSNWLNANLPKYISVWTSWGEFEVTERQITVGELKSCSERGRLLEAFGVGTAVTILPVVAIKREKGSQLFCKRSSTKDMQLTNRIRNTMFDIQFGRVEHEWAVTIWLFTHRDLILFQYPLRWLIADWLEFGSCRFPWG